MPTTAVAEQLYTAAVAREQDADFSILVRFIEELAGVADRLDTMAGSDTRTAG